MEYIGIIFGIILVNNYVIERLIGLNPFIVGPRSIQSSLYLGLSLSTILFISMIVIYPIYINIIIPLKLFYLDLLIITFITILLITILYKLIKNYFPNIYNRIGVYFPIIIFNSTIFGALFSLDIKYVNDYISALIYAVFCGVGYSIALILINLLKNKISQDSIPEAFKGIPTTLIVSGIISMIFQFLGNIITNI